MCSSYLPLGVPNWTVKNYQHRTASRHFYGAVAGEQRRRSSHVNLAPARHFYGAVAGEKEDFCKGSFARTSFTLF
jgi:hypothetical protein